MQRVLLSLAVPGALAIASIAHAQTSLNGTYIIKSMPSQFHSNGCLYNYKSIPSFYEIRNCAGPHYEEKHLWEIHDVGGLHVIRSRADGRCLIRGENGRGMRPVLYLWGENPDKTNCGLADAAALHRNGQALWDLSSLVRSYAPGSGLPEFRGTIQLPKFPGSVLAAVGQDPWGWGSAAVFDPTWRGWRVAFVPKPAELPTH